MTKYIRNADGGVHSVTDDHFDEHMLVTTQNGSRYLKPGIAEITEAEARAAHPQLFGQPDPEVLKAMTPAELVELSQKRRLEAELNGPVA